MNFSFDCSKTVLVLGGSGFIGRHISNCFLDKGWRVVSTYYPEPLKLEGVEQIELDFVSSPESLKELFDFKPSVVVNAAAYGVDPKQENKKALEKVNVELPLQAYKYSVEYGVKHFIQLGSCFEYGVKSGVISESTPEEPVTAYALSKLEATCKLKDLSLTGDNLKNTPLSILRLFHVWGPGEKEYRLMPSVFSACLKNKPLALSPGEQVRDISYVKDVSFWVYEMAHSPNPEGYQLLNVGSGEGKQLKDLVLDMAKELGCENLMKFGEIDYRPNELMELTPDIQKLKAVLKGRHKVTPFLESVKDAKQFYERDI